VIWLLRLSSLHARQRNRALLRFSGTEAIPAEYQPHVYANSAVKKRLLPITPTVGRTHTIAAEMPIHCPSRISISICILLYEFLAPLEFYLRLTEAVVMRKRRASRALAIDAVAMHREFIDACHGERDFAAVAAD
jgi:hypothetical protein